MHLHHYSCFFFFFDPFSWIFTLFSLVFMNFPYVYPFSRFFLFFTCLGVFTLGYLYCYASNLCYKIDCDRCCGDLGTFEGIMVRFRGDEIHRFPFIFAYFYGFPPMYTHFRFFFLCFYMFRCVYIGLYVLLCAKLMLHTRLRQVLWSSEHFWENYGPFQGG